jgi:hypothetical protein
LSLCPVWEWEFVSGALYFVFGGCVARGFTVDFVFWEQSTKDKAQGMLTLVRGFGKSEYEVIGQWLCAVLAEQVLRRGRLRFAADQGPGSLANLNANCSDTGYTDFKFARQTAKREVAVAVGFGFERFGRETVIVLNLSPAQSAWRLLGRTDCPSYVRHTQGLGRATGPTYRRTFRARP